MQAKTILSNKGSDVVTVTPEARVGDVARLFKDNRIGFALVSGKKGTGISGTVSERDIIHGLALHDGAIAAHPVNTVMTTNVVTCGPDDSAETLMSLMTEKRTRHLLVMDGKTLLGVVSIGDLIKTQVSHYQHEAKAMHDYVVGAGYN